MYHINYPADYPFSPPQRFFPSTLNEREIKKEAEKRKRKKGERKRDKKKEKKKENADTGKREILRDRERVGGEKEGRKRKIKRL